MPHTIAKPQSSATTPRVQNSNHQLDEIYKSIGHELWALFYAFCSDPENASDALQESFLRLQRQDLSSIKNPRSWLIRVGRNWLRDVARKKKRSAVSVGALWDCSDPGKSAYRSCAGAETREVIRSAMQQLREPDRLALTLFYGMNWPSRRIAETLETTSEAIDMRLCRARWRLREILLELQPDFALSALRSGND